jgi:nucleotide-binding universal stress UspA family protein
MKKILVGTDGSDAAHAAVDAGIDLTVDEGAELIFAHVISVLDFAPQTNGAEVPPERIPRIEEDAALRDALALAQGQGLEAKGELLIGYPSKQILRLAKEVEADLIVVGSRGLGRMKSAMLGSTSKELLSQADRPVLVVRETTREALTV